MPRATWSDPASCILSISHHIRRKLNVECDNSLSNYLYLTTSPCPTAAAKKGVKLKLLLLKTST